MTERYINISGQKFGMLTAMNVHRTENKRRTRWFCVCECGKEILVLSYSLRSGLASSCGCKQKRYKHGHTIKRRQSPEYSAWIDMKKRCLNPNNKDFSYYGARRITICNRWKNSFENFYADMGTRPKGMILDRRDNDGNYEPGNCRWVTRKIQADNRRPRSKANA